MVLFVKKLLQILDLDQVVLNNLAGRREESLSHSWHCDIDPFRADEFPSIRKDKRINMFTDYIITGLFWKICLFLVQ